MTLAFEQTPEPWRRRLYVPNYQIGEAARYAQVSPQTVAAWHKLGARTQMTLSEKESRAALSYLQLIEVAVVAAARKAGVKLSDIRAAREYVATQLKSEFPFSEYKFKTDGKDLILDYEDVEGEKGRDAILLASQAGQLAWKAMYQRLREFDYEDGGVVVRWHVAGRASPIIIDPRISFGSPTIDSIPTWVIKGRWQAGESDKEISDDFDISIPNVRKALRFEGILARAKRPKWVH